MPWTEEEFKAEKEFRSCHPKGFSFDELRALNLEAGPDDVERPWQSDNGTTYYDYDDPYIWGHVAEKLSSDTAVAARMGRYWDGPFDAEWLKRHAHDLGRDYLSGLTHNEVARLHHSLTFSGRLSDVVSNTPRLAYVNKIANSAWRWGVAKLRWKQIVAFHDAFLRFDWGVEGFEVTLDHSTWYNERGHSQWSHTLEAVKGYDKPQKMGTWLDGTFAFLIHHKGEHVLTVTVSPTGKGLLLNQVQLKRKKGNRWLYSLPKGDDGQAVHHYDWAVGRVYAAFEGSGIPILVVDGESAADGIWRSYHENKPADWDVVRPRIVALYDRSVTGFRYGDNVRASAGNIGGNYRHLLRAA